MVDLEAAYIQYQPQILGWLRQRVPNEAEDICSQVFLEAIQRTDRYQDRGYPLSAWLYTMAHSRVVDEIRRKARRPVAPLAEWASIVSGPEERIEEVDYLRWLCMCLGGNQRRVIWLRFVEGVGPTEIAARLGMTVSSVKMLQRRGLANLKKALGTDGPR